MSAFISKSSDTSESLTSDGTETEKVDQALLNVMLFGINAFIIVFPLFRLFFTGRAKKGLQGGIILCHHFKSCICYVGCCCRKPPNKDAEKYEPSFPRWKADLEALSKPEDDISEEIQLKVSV